MKRRWEARRQAECKPTDKPNLITGPIQICWHKFTRYWDIEHRETPMDKGRLLMTPEEVLSRCDENTIGVVPTLGVTFTGEYEPVRIKRSIGFWSATASARASVRCSSIT
ncbi:MULTISPECIES: pyridoxal-dependent decarboxylase [Thiorhodovibrio]|uniref:pyridoxal-dependent decarboxylase n=1 Tax=Thiorhodovibrio TaxID=61593 RepID=UPI001F5D94A9|nr:MULTISPECIES: pyridoxal-dependent decarboxylase [Thiorhodovibrio]MBK5970179.1 hypothetical protein [Thiorhodovibrio winogradskyi]WPL13988.1 Glutamate decarboxylase alpha [Thiorhodovibrio litoralis]